MLNNLVSSSRGTFIIHNSSQIPLTQNGHPLETVLRMYVLTTETTFQGLLLPVQQFQLQ